MNSMDDISITRSLSESSYEEFDPRGTAASQCYESFTVTTTASFSMEDTYSIRMESKEAESVSVLHRHEERTEVREEVESVRGASYTEAFDLDPRSDMAKEGELWNAKGLKEKSFTISGVSELHELLRTEEKDIRTVSEDECGSGGAVPVIYDETVIHSPSRDQEDGLELLEWKKQNALLLEAKENRERDKLSSIIAAAEEHKHDFYARRDKHRDAVKTANRNKEKSFLVKREKFHATAYLNYWNAVSELISTEPPLATSQGKKKPAVAKNHGPKPGKATDLARMRQLILKLKYSSPNMMEPEDGDAAGTKMHKVSEVVVTA